jgi:hypothetical protein
MDFSRAECFDTTAIGKSTSASRLHSLGIMGINQSIKDRRRISDQELAQFDYSNNKKNLFFHHPI